jgi:hypothetical protein
MSAEAKSLISLSMVALLLLVAFGPARAEIGEQQQSS